MRFAPIMTLLVCGISPASAAETFAGYTFWVGDPHAHTAVSWDASARDDEVCPACGEQADVFTSAKAAGLDWVAYPDHVNGGEPADAEAWASFQQEVLAADHPAGGFVTVPAAEIWVTEADGHPLGHVTFMAFGDAADLAGLTIEELRPEGDPDGIISECSAFWDHLDALSARRGPVLAIPHHPGMTAPTPWDWRCTSQIYTPAVEVYSEHGASMGDGQGFDPTWSREAPEGTVHAAMDPDRWAHHLGFLAGSDAHDNHPGSVCSRDAFRQNQPYAGGLTMVVGDAGETLDRDVIFRAITTGRTYGTSGPAIPVLVRWSTGGADLGGMGERLGIPSGQSLHAEVSIPESWAAFVTSVELVQPGTRLALEPDGAEAWIGELSSEQIEEWVYVAVRIDGAAAFGDTCADGGSVDWAWLSPSWVERAAPDLDGDGVPFLGGDCDDGDPAVNPLRAEVPNDGIDQDCDGGDEVREDDDGDDHEGDVSIGGGDEGGSDGQDSGGQGSDHQDSDDGTGEDEPADVPVSAGGATSPSSRGGCNTAPASVSLLLALAGLLGLRRR